MSLYVNLNNMLSNVNFNTNDTNTMYFVVDQVMQNIRGNPAIEKNNMNKFNQFWDKFSGKFDNTTINPVNMQNLDASSSKDLVLLAVAYYLSNLNTYDFNLINYCNKVNMDTSDIIILLLLNDMQTINNFCKVKSIHSQSYYVILTLKRLSALHKVEYNFG